MTLSCKKKVIFQRKKQTIDLESFELVSVPLKIFKRPAHKLDIENAKKARSVALQKEETEIKKKSRSATLEWQWAQLK